MTWEFETSGLDGQCELFGVNIFQYRWRDCRERAAVIDPHYGTEKAFHVYEVVSMRWRLTGRSAALPPGSSPTACGDFIWRKTDERSVMP